MDFIQIGFITSAELHIWLGDCLVKFVFLTGIFDGTE
jgi:hypothetical protein